MVCDISMPLPLQAIDRVTLFDREGEVESPPPLLLALSRFATVMYSSSVPHVTLEGQQI